MALPKKGTRHIKVDGRDYRWIVSPNDGWIDIIVEQYENPAQRLVARTGYGDTFDESGIKSDQRTKITPGFVRRAIVSALARGWNPALPGKDVRLDIE